MAKEKTNQPTAEDVNAMVTTEETVSPEQTVLPEPPTEPQPEPQPDTGRSNDRTLFDKLSEKHPRFAAFLRAAGIPDMLLIRMIAAFFIVSGFNVLFRRYDAIAPIAVWKDFLNHSSLGMIILMSLLLFLALTLLRITLPPKLRVSDQIAAVAGLLFFNFEVMWRNGNFYNCAGTIVITLIFFYYILNKTDTTRFSQKLSGRACFAIVLCGTLFAFAFICVISLYRHWFFVSKYDDLGIFVQMFYSLITHKNANTTCERYEVLSHFRVHASYILLLLAPIYKLIPRPETLLILQAIFAEAGIIPFYLIAKRHKFTGIPLIFLCGCYTFAVAIIGPCFFDFHENALLPTLLMWLIWSLEYKKYVPAYIFTVLVCIVKEDAPLFVILLCLYFFFHEKDSRRAAHGFVMASMAGAYMLLITTWLNKNGNGVYMTDTRFEHLMITKGSGLSAVIKTVLTDPAYFFSLFFQEKTLMFFFEIMISLLFVPFMTKKIYRYLLMLPFLLTNLVIGAQYEAAAKIEMQYIFGPYCLLLYMCILNLSDMEAERKYQMPVIMAAASFLLSFGMYTERIRWITGYKNNQQYYVGLQNVLDQLPKDAKVGVDSFLVPHVANRDEVYMFDGNQVDMDTHLLKHPEHFDIIVMPMSWYKDWGEEFVAAQDLVLVAEYQNASRIYYTREYYESHPPAIQVPQTTQPAQ